MTVNFAVGLDASADVARYIGIKKAKANNIDRFYSAFPSPNGVIFQNYR
jgi:hypothetical protein